VAGALDLRDTFYEWTNDLFGSLPFDLKQANLMGLVAALSLGNQRGVSYFYGAAKKAGATDEELTAAVSISVAATGLHLYGLAGEAAKASES